VLVGGGTAPGNGPADPDPTVGINSSSGGTVTGDLSARDRDGYVRRLIVTWPDGSTRTIRNPTPCTDPGDRWPSSELSVPFTRMLAPGTHTVTLTATSTDCAGGSQQTITDVRRFEVTATGWTNPPGANTYRPHAPRTGWTGAALS
jgi:hypothetical protein